MIYLDVKMTVYAEHCTVIVRLLSFNINLWTQKKSA
jgi:hypothetical protein